ncbi:MAG: hypothetical protein JW984_13750 [Deltaproteobacteria bacterium]|uniref:Uncharacterized protein n=1 Tax=Candidatus Zymogenus saltonus TaxID=2844893 RepID=A0A9D8KHM3_9DELT|nr:hypothetical protein [Candidatus Zymogenus saltonus]
MKIKVETYSGYKADERPTVFYIGNRKHRIVEVTDRWYDPSADYFKVKAEDGGVYILVRNREGDFWELRGFFRE